MKTEVFLLFYQVQGPFLIAELRCYEGNLFQVHFSPAPHTCFFCFGFKIYIFSSIVPGGVQSHGGDSE